MLEAATNRTDTEPAELEAIENELERATDRLLQHLVVRACVCACVIQLVCACLLV